MRRILCFVLVFGLAQCQDLNLDDLLSELFTTPSGIDGNWVTTPRGVTHPGGSGGGGPPTSAPIHPATGANTCHGECVPYYLCNNGSVITDGSGLIDIRIDIEPTSQECSDYLETCCALGDRLPEPLQPVTPAPQVSGCGVRNTNGIGFRISGNQDNEAEFGEFPWMVAILKEERGLPQILNAYQCGGSLIHPQVVLTGAHCVEGKDVNLLKVRAGEWDTQTNNEFYKHEDARVQSIVMHPQYSRSNLVNDVALLILREPMPMGQHIATVCLPPQNTNFDRSRCYASGWGKDVFGKEGKYQVILKKIDLPMVRHLDCERAMQTTRLGRRFQLSDTFVCAGGEAGKDTCKGDGGSPLVCPINGPSNNRYYQAGIVAWGIGCGENQVPGVYVNVAKFKYWIDTEMNRRNFGTSSYTP